MSQPVETLVAQMKYTFITVWHTSSPVEPVWQAITRVEDWPTWWRGDGERKGWGECSEPRSKAGREKRATVVIPLDRQHACYVKLPAPSSAQRFLVFAHPAAEARPEDEPACVQVVKVAPNDGEQPPNVDLASGRVRGSSHASFSCRCRNLNGT